MPRTQRANYRLQHSSLARRGLLAVLVVCAVLTLGIGPDGSPLVFVDETPLELSLTGAQEGAKLGICNVGRDQLAGVTAQLKGFDSPLDQRMIIEGGQVGLLNSSDCRTLSLQATQGSAPDPGTYRGVVLLSADTMDPVARQVNVKVEARSLTSAAKPIRVTKWWPSNMTRIAPPGCIAPLLTPLAWPYCARDLVRPPENEHELPLKSKDGAKLEVKDGDVLGVLAGGFGDGYAKVVAAEDLEDKIESGSVRALPVHVEGLEGVGTYTGTLSIDGVDYEIEMFVSDTLLWALFFVLVGIALAGLALFAAKKWVPGSRLRKRCDELEGKYAKALERFQGKLDDRKTALTEAEMDEDKAESIIQNLRAFGIDGESRGAYQERFRWLLEDYAKQNYFFDTSAEDYKQLLATLESAESDIRHFGDPEGLGKSLQDLALALYRFDKYLREDLGLDPQLWPALVAPAAAKIKGGPLKVGAAKEISEQAKAYTGLIADWRKSLKQFLRYYIWAALLEERFENMEPARLPKDDRKALRTAAGKVVEAFNELLDAESAAALKELGAAEDLKEAYKTLSGLGGKYDVWLVMVEPGTEEEQLEKAKNTFAQAPESFGRVPELLLKRLPDDEADRPDIAALAAGTLFTSPSPRPQPINVRRFSPIATAVMGVGLALLIALIATFAAEVYPETGKAFGTTKDYLAAITAGATGAALATVLQGPLSNLLTRLRPGG